MDNMDNLKTIQKREKLNTVRTCGEKGNGGAYHTYEIVGEVVTAERLESNLSIFVQFQNGPRNLSSSTPGVLDVDLLEIARHRLQCFQEGDLKTRENAIALTHIEEALLWMNKRVEDRIERGVLGTNKK